MKNNNSLNVKILECNISFARTECCKISKENWVGTVNYIRISWKVSSKANVKNKEERSIT